MSVTRRNGCADPMDAPPWGRRRSVSWPGTETIFETSHLYAAASSADLIRPLSGPAGRDKVVAADGDQEALAGTFAALCDRPEGGWGGDVTSCGRPAGCAVTCSGSNISSGSPGAATVDAAIRRAARKAVTRGDR